MERDILSVSVLLSFRINKKAHPTNQMSFKYVAKIFSSFESDLSVPTFKVGMELAPFRFALLIVT
jgi:hypothetical protein